MTVGDSRHFGGKGGGGGGGGGRSPPYSGLCKEALPQYGTVILGTGPPNSQLI